MPVTHHIEKDPTCPLNYKLVTRYYGRGTDSTTSKCATKTDIRDYPEKEPSSKIQIVPQTRPIEKLKEPLRKYPKTTLLICIVISAIGYGVLAKLAQRS